jgi:hypothetical protein
MVAVAMVMVADRDAGKVVDVVLVSNTLIYFQQTSI